MKQEINKTGPLKVQLAGTFARDWKSESSLQLAEAPHKPGDANWHVTPRRTTSTIHMPLCPSHGGIMGLPGEPDSAMQGPRKEQVSHRVWGMALESNI